MPHVSQQGADAIEDKELWVVRAYKDSGGVVTVGAGLTMLSKTFSEWWLATRGRNLRVGDTLSKAEGMPVFRKALDTEYLPAVVRAWGPNRKQHEYDGGASVSYNAGTGSLKWEWAQAIGAGKVTEGCRLLLTTAITAGGRVLNGLKTRRKAEARMIEFGDYGAARAPSTEGGSTASAISTSTEEVKEYQRDLTTLGYYKGVIDGKRGELTIGAVKNFQRASKLKVDGKVGPATRSALARAVTAKNQGITVVGSGTVSGGGALGFDVDPWVIVGVAAGVVLLLVVVFVIWNNRGVIFRRRTAA